MINITLPNGSVKEFDAAGVTPLEVAKSLSNSLPKKAVAAVVDGTLGGQLTPEDAEQQLQQIQNSYAALTGGNAGK